MHSENQLDVSSLPPHEADNLPPSAAKLEYQRRLQERQSTATQLQRKHLWLGNTRIGVFVAIVFLGWKAAGSSLAFYLLIAAIILFIVLVIVHRRVVRAMNAARRAVKIYERGLARIEDRWSTGGEKGDEFKDPLHLYAEDLDILGEGSLFQLLCTARTRMGKACLANWLLTQASPHEIAERQAAVAELRQKLDLLEDLAVLGENERIDAHAEKLSRWAIEHSGMADGRWWALALAMLNVAALVCGFLVLWTPLVLMLLINGVIMFRLRHRLETVFAGLDESHRDLDSLAEILRRVETEKFTSPRLQQLQARLMTQGLPPSECIQKLDTLADLNDSRHNWFVRLFDVPLLYSLQVGFTLDRWRRRYGVGVAAWLEVTGQIETLSALATYSFEHPDDPFPEFAPSGGPPVFTGQSLGHPLLPQRQCVRNDVLLGGRNQVLLVSGSNMSGKSTYLRVVGINAVLAMMGAPVRAAKLSLSCTTVGASMRISDSLRQGVSHFYAEIKRVRQVVDLSASGSSLFLLDEILQGTNSDDRRVGTQGILRTLIHNGAIGLVTTHDLALASLEQIFPDRLLNVHFQERFEADRLSFDYRLRPGVVTTSNGVELMRSIGLDVS
ncbi:MAG TPA: mismatch repair protein [Candidatus Angelobacter sp.]|nr:mismatch repair protein [Candidatus Angelobacter sp.]